MNIKQFAYYAGAVTVGIIVASIAQPMIDKLINPAPAMPATTTPAK